MVTIRCPSVMQIRVPLVDSVSFHRFSRSMDVQSPVFPSLFSTPRFSSTSSVTRCSSGKCKIPLSTCLRTLSSSSLSAFIYSKTSSLKDSMRNFYRKSDNDDRFDSERSGKAAKDGFSMFLSLSEGCFHWLKRTTALLALRAVRLSEFDYMRIINWLRVQWIVSISQESLYGYYRYTFHL